MTVQCCICQKVRNDKQWVEPEGKPARPISHTYCPFCLSETLRDYRQDWHESDVGSLAPESV